MFTLLFTFYRFQCNTYIERLQSINNNMKPVKVEKYCTRISIHI